MKIKIAVSLSFVIMFAGCYKEPAYDQLSSNFTVTTNRDVKIDFGAYKTYFISDTVAFASGNPKDSLLPAAEARKLVDAVKANMASRGYTFVPKSSKPDLGINMGALKNTDVSVIYPGWWWGYPGWWDGMYWGWDFPYYYPYSVAYVITSGNLIVDIIDLKSAVPKQKIEVVWNAFVGGGLSTTTTINIDMAADAIDQAFLQSPYLKAK